MRQKLMANKIARQKERGIQIENLWRTMIIGIPNAGKSTSVNRLAGKKIGRCRQQTRCDKGSTMAQTNKDLEIPGYTRDSLA